MITAEMLATESSEKLDALFWEGLEKMDRIELNTRNNSQL